MHYIIQTVSFLGFYFEVNSDQVSSNMHRVNAIINSCLLRILVIQMVMNNIGCYNRQF